ncbi:MAG: response regulator [Candidatus Margulisiibacteriota bacterium]
MSRPYILIVDDEKEITDELSATISETQKYRVIAANSAHDALHALKKHNGRFSPRDGRIRLVLLDIKMPEMNGLELAEKIKHDYGGREDTIGLMLLTAYEDKEKWHKAIEYHVVAYLRKPYKSEELLKKIERYFSTDWEAPYMMVSDTIEEGIDRMEKMRQEEQGNG